MGVNYNSEHNLRGCPPLWWSLSIDFSTYMLWEEPPRATRRPPVCNGTSSGWLFPHWSVSQHKCPGWADVRACPGSKLKKDRWTASWRHCLIFLMLQQKQLWFLKIHTALKAVVGYIKVGDPSVSQVYSLGVKANLCLHNSQYSFLLCFSHWTKLQSNIPKVKSKKINNGKHVLFECLSKKMQLYFCTSC